MRILAVFLAAGLVLAGTVANIVRHQRRSSLSAKRFAASVAIGWSGAVGIFFFLGFALAEDIDLEPGLIGLGAGVVLLNLLLGYPASLVMYKRFLSQLLPKSGSSSDSV